LTRAGLIDSSKRGVWALTAEGRNTSLSHEEALEVFRVTHRELPDEHGPEDSSGDEDATEDEEEPAVAHRSALMQKLLSMPPDAFERLCQRLLRESGFEKVHVTGRSGDGGLDGNGVLQVNPFVSFQVLFQCKRYQGSVGAPVVRDFRGAMMGRADKGIILTTGTFTAEAHKEAVRDGVPPIELVDGDKLLGLMESLELGVTPVTAYEIDERFFNQLTGS
jgi:restriction system protein